MLPPTPQISPISHTISGSRFEDSTRLILATTERGLVESLQSLFNDFGCQPQIEETSDMLDMKDYLSVTECPGLSELPLYYGYILHFKTPVDGASFSFSCSHSLLI